MPTINGVKGRKQNILPPLVFPRYDEDGQREDLVIRVQTVWSLDPFRKMVPKPDPKNYGGRHERNDNGKLVFVADPESQGYKEAWENYLNKQSQYLFLEAIKPSNIEWDRVNPSNSDTWKHIDDEMAEMLSEFERRQVLALIDRANSLNDDVLEENRKTFFTRARSAEQEHDKKTPILSQESSESSKPA